MTRTEVLVCVACAVLFGVFAIVAFRHGDKPGHVTRSRDASQLRGIHQSWLVYAHDNNGVLPTPGLMRRLPVNGEIEPGRGEEDVEANTTANLYSSCLIQNYFTPEILISPVERNPRVAQKDDYQYDYTAYQPGANVYWDTTFKADLASGSNVSYAHMPVWGERKIKEWKDTANGGWPILGNRGPINGMPAVGSYACDSNGRWSGHVVNCDGSVRFLEEIPGDRNQNIFTPSDGKALITFTKGFENGRPEYQFD